ncbi:Hypothetical protein KVN_LOCUS372 [uncultured virus]|nr:Hypothetical protein KVN_LOCUS372 [uncultured virus]
MKTEGKKNFKYIDYLNEDEPINGQNWVCISFLSPEGIRNCSTRGLKIRGVFSNKEDAQNKAKALQVIDPDFNVFVGEIGKWLPWDPDPNSIPDQVYQEEELNKIMQGYKANLEKTKIMEQQRRTDQVNQVVVEEQKHDNKTKNRLQKKLEEKKKKKIIEDIAKRQISMENNFKKEDDIKIEDEIKIEDKIVKKEMIKLQETKKQINETAANLNSIDDKLLKIQTLYDKLQKKNLEKTN